MGFTPNELRHYLARTQGGYKGWLKAIQKPWLTMDETRRIASNIAKLPSFLAERLTSASRI
jgi:hypothetical protein